MTEAAPVVPTTVMKMETIPSHFGSIWLAQPAPSPYVAVPNKRRRCRSDLLQEHHRMNADPTKTNSVISLGLQLVINMAQCASTNCTEVQR